MAVQERLYSSADLLALPCDDKRYELVKGQLIEMSPTGGVHGLLTNRVSYLVTILVEKDDLGQVFGAETGFRLAENPDTVRGIDVAFISKANLKPITEDYYPGAPDLAVEIVSPGNTKSEMHAKVKEYFDAGARLVWIMYPKSRVIYAYRSPRDVQILESDETLTGGDVLPGFSVKVADIFAVLDK